MNIYRVYVTHPEHSVWTCDRFLINKKHAARYLRRIQKVSKSSNSGLIYKIERYKADAKELRMIKEHRKRRKDESMMAIERETT